MLDGQNNSFPNYLKIQNYILEQIQSGALEAGSKIPTEVELARMFSVSRVTANKAIKEMALMGILRRVRGKGTFVCAPHDTNTESKAFAGVNQLNITGSRSHELIQFRVLEGDPALLKKMGLPEHSMLYEIVLANKNKGKLESYDYTVIPQVYVTDIVDTLNYLKNHFVFTYLKTSKKLQPKYLRIFPNPVEPSFLDIPPELSSGQTWYTDICDADMKLLATIYTIFLDSNQEIPLFVFSI